MSASVTNTKSEGETIYVVEDDAGLLQLIGKHLRRLGYAHELFSSEEQAMARIIDQPPILLMLDYQLPRLSGKEFLEALAGHCPLPPFIIITGHGNETIAVKMMKLGAIDYLIKDNVFLDLLPTVVEQAVCHIRTQRKLTLVEQERAQLQEQLNQAQKMEAIGTLAGGIAHDFNNILAAILGYAEMSLEHIPESNPAHAMLPKVIDASLRARDLVRQILDFSRKSAVTRIPIQLHLLVKETIKLLRASIPSTIEIKQAINIDCGYVLADPTQIHQVLINLCTNAAQAMEEGGELRVALDGVTLTTQELTNEPTLTPGPYVRLTIADTGSGIDPTILGRIFEPYFTTKEVGKGSGMGLAVVHGAVTRHHGMIRVESVLGQGTTFTVYFPQVCQVEKAKEEASKEALARRGDERLLVIDDDPAIVDMLTHLFATLGYRITGETDSQAALDHFRGQPEAFDLVITDQTMPKLTGEQLSRAMLAIRPNLPILLCTGFSYKIDDHKAAEIGIKAFIMKPFTNRDISELVRDLLDGAKDNSQQFLG